jgi:hypothetical protein
VAGTVTISDPNVTTSSKVQVSVKTAGGTVGTYYQNTVAQGSLVITHKVIRILCNNLYNYN